MCETPTDYQLRDGNGPSLRALLGLRRWTNVVAMQRLHDDEAAINRALAHAARPTTEGGARRHPPLRRRLDGSAGLRARRHPPRRRRGGVPQTPQRPGKPMLGAVLGDGRPIFGLPGNPMSVLVTAVRIAMPVLARRAGSNSTPLPTQVRLTINTAKPQLIWWFRPVRLTPPGEAELVPATGSGDVISIASSDGFIECPPNAEGTGPFPFYPWSGL